MIERSKKNFFWQNMDAVIKGNNDTTRMIVFCLCWYISSSLSSIMGKEILNKFPRPLTVTYCSFLLNISYGFLLNALAPIATIEKPSQRTMEMVAPYSVCRIVSHLASTVSLGRIEVSLVHTIKAIGPLFSVFFAWLLLRQSTSNHVLLSLVPICAGVMLACFADGEFDWIGIMSALVSVSVLSFQAILTKRIFVTTSLNEFSLLFYSSLFCVIFITPFWILFELPSLWVDDTMQTVLHPSLLLLLALTGLAQYSQGTFSYATVSIATPITQAVASATKRIFVIILSIIWFDTEVSLLNIMGILLTFVGMLIYNQVVTRQVDLVLLKEQQKSDGDVRMAKLV